MSKNNNSATRRLLRDFMELTEALENDDSLLVSAHYKEDDIFTWYCNLLAPTDSPQVGSLIHLHLTFTNEYPKKPPSVNMPVKFEHAHVLSGNRICLDLLGTHGAEKWGGWNSSYSVLSLLVQLQNFLFYDVDRKTTPETMASNKKAAHELKCTCGHDAPALKPFPWEDKWLGKYPWPPANVNSNDAAKVDDQTNATASVPSVKQQQSLPVVNYTALFNKDVALLQRVFNFLIRGSSNQSLYKHADSKIMHKTISSVNSIWRRALMHSLSPLIADFVCVHSKLTHRDETLGITLNLVVSKVNHNLLGIKSSVEFTSYTAFHMDKIRETSSHDSIEAWMPLYINEYHAMRSFSIFRRAIESLHSFIKDKQKDKREGNEEVLHTLTERLIHQEQNQEASGFKFEEFALVVLIKSMGACMFDVASKSLHPTRALNGCVLYLQWMNFLLQKYPHLQHFVAFHADQQLHNSHLIETAPEFLVWIALSKVHSQLLFQQQAETNTIIQALTNEMLDRTVKYALKRNIQVETDNLQNLFKGSAKTNYALVSAKYTVELICNLVKAFDKEPTVAAFQSRGLLHNLNGLIQDENVLQQYKNYVTRLDNTVQNFKHMMKELQLPYNEKTILSDAYARAHKKQYIRKYTPEYRKIGEEMKCAGKRRPNNSERGRSRSGRGRGRGRGRS